MTRDESKKVYNLLCAEYGKKVTAGEFSAFDKYVSKISTEQYQAVLNIGKGYLNDFDSKPYPSHFDKAIKQYLGKPTKKQPEYNENANQLEINRRGALLVNYILFQQQLAGKVAKSKVKDVKTLFYSKSKKTKETIKRLYQKGDWIYFAKKLASGYPYKIKIDEMAKREIEETK